MAEAIRRQWVGREACGLGGLDEGNGSYPDHLLALLFFLLPVASCLALGSKGDGRGNENHQSLGAGPVNQIPWGTVLPATRTRIPG